MRPVHAATAAALLLLVATAAVPGQAQDPGPAPVPGPGVTVLVHHPWPDDADPLGFPWPDEDGTGSFFARHGRLDRDGGGFPFPTVVVDGVLPLEGLPGTGQDIPQETGAPGQQVRGDPVQDTLAAYDALVQERLREQSALALEVSTEVLADTVEATVTLDPVSSLPGESLRLWLAIVEDPVHYRPPPALSNGVFDHPFTLRSLHDAGSIDLAGGEPLELHFMLPRDPGWIPEHLLLAAWVQQGAASGPRFQGHEVVQSTMHPALQDAATRQEEKGVLVEAFSATWCAPCLFGDRALEALAEQHGLPVERGVTERGWVYLHPADHWPLALLGAVAVGLAAALLPVRGGGRRP